MKKIKIDHAAALLGAAIDSVPAKDEVVKVSMDSVSEGGSAINVTDLVHPDWLPIIKEFSSTIGLFVCAWDIICEDIAAPIEDKYLPLLEINSAPGVKLHHYPTGGGDPIDVVSIILDEVFGIAKN